MGVEEVGAKVGRGVGPLVVTQRWSVTSGLKMKPSLQMHSYVNGLMNPSSTQSIVSLSQPWSPSVHKRGVGMCVGVREGAKVGAGVGNWVGPGVSQTPPAQILLPQSLSYAQVLPGLQPQQEPPQSTSDSSSSLMLLMQ